MSAALDYHRSNDMGDLAWDSSVPWPDVVWDPGDPKAGFSTSTTPRLRSIGNRGRGSTSATLSRTTAANAPPLTIINGKRVADFSGGSVVLQGPLAGSGIMDPLHDPNTNCTVIAFLNIAALSGVEQRVLCLNRTTTTATSKGVIVTLNSSNQWQLRVSNGTSDVVSATAAAATGKSRLAVRKQLLAYDAKLNDAALLSGTAASLVAGNGSAQTNIGAASSTGTAPFSGSIGRIYTWLSTALNDTQLTAVDTMLVNYYGA